MWRRKIKTLLRKETKRTLNIKGFKLFEKTKSSVYQFAAINWKLIVICSLIGNIKFIISAKKFGTIQNYFFFQFVLHISPFHLSLCFCLILYCLLNCWIRTLHGGLKNRSSSNWSLFPKILVVIGTLRQKVETEHSQQKKIKKSRKKTILR